MMQLPPYLGKGDRIGITAPARWVEEKDLNHFIRAVEGQGWEVRTGRIQTRHHQFAGSDGERLADLQAMLDDPEIKAVICARGGYGTGRLIDRVDLNALASRPKWIAGFSDVTALHCLILMKIGMAVLHSPMPYTLGEGKDEAGLSSLIRALRGEFTDYEIPPHPLNRNGNAQGLLLGGNLSVLFSLTGTSFQIPTRGAVLFLEDVDEYLYHLDRMMLNLRMSGMLKNLNGLIIGGMTDMHDNEVPFGKNAYGIIRDTVEPYGFPVCFGFPAGHQVPNLTLVLGREVHLEVEPGGCRMNYIE
jgi:muramoyltetrapeptide carboxypeptidase